MIHLDYKDSRPIYEQVADRLKELMILGVLEEDGQMPSVRSLATELSINPNTIQRLCGTGTEWIYLFGQGTGKLCGKHQQTPGTEMPRARREGSRSCGGGKKVLVWTKQHSSAWRRNSLEERKQYDRGNQSHKKI